MRRLIINADDFGLTPGVNQAVLEANKNGVVTSTTLMATGTAFDHAVRLSKSASQLSVGCHIVLTDGKPVLRVSQVPTLVRGGNFRDPLNNFVWAAFSGKLSSDQIEAEATAQIQKLQSAGIAVSHLDSHKHTHLFPQVLRPMLRAAEACGVRAIRNPFGPVRFTWVAGRPGLWKRYTQVKVLDLLANKFRKATEKAGLKTPDGTIGIVGTGGLDETILAAIVSDLPDGTWEFVSHPGYNDADLQKIKTRLRESRLKELKLLTSPGTRELLARNEIELISYQDFVNSNQGGMEARRHQAVWTLISP